MSNDPITYLSYLDCYEPGLINSVLMIKKLQHFFS